MKIAQLDPDPASEKLRYKKFTF